MTSFNETISIHSFSITLPNIVDTLNISQKTVVKKVL